MADEPSERLLARWRGGDQQAVAVLTDRYTARLFDLAENRLSVRLSVRVAPEDIVQSVYRSFFSGVRDGRFSLRRPGDLWRLLAAITLHKVRHHARFHRAGRRSIDRERSLDWDDSRSPVGPDALAVGRPPEEGPAFDDAVAKALAGLEPWERAAVEMRLQGHTLVEIADATGRAFSTVRRLLEQFKARFERAVADV